MKETTLVNLIRKAAILTQVCRRSSVPQFIKVLALSLPLLGSFFGTSFAATQTWTTPGEYYWTVPAGITAIGVDMAGAAGSGSNGSNGSRLQTTVPVTPGSTLTIIVGSTAVNTSIPGHGGFGTSDSYCTGYDGGGASEIRPGGGSPIAVAGGGGGGDTCEGATSGGTLSSGGCSTDVAGSGSGATCYSDQDINCDDGGGGGGGGWCPGSSGDNYWDGYYEYTTSASGGQSYSIGSAGSAVATAGYQTGNGYVSITIPVPPPPTVTLSGPSAIITGASATVTASVSPSTGVTETWTLPDGTTQSGTNSVTYTSKVSDGGSLTFKLSAYPNGYPTQVTTKTFTVTNVTQPQALAISGPSSLNLGGSGTYTASAVVPSGLPPGTVIDYSLTQSTGTTVSGNTATYTFTSTTQNTVTAKAWFDGYPSDVATTTTTITLNYPPPTVSVNCPASLYTYQPGTCTLTATASYGTVGYNWSVDGVAVSGSAATNTISIPTSGPHTVTATAFITQQPSSSASDSASINVATTNITATISCPSTFYTTLAGTCTATATSDWGTPSFTWTANGATQVPSGASDSITYTATGNQTIKVAVSITEASAVTTTASQTVAVTGLSVPTNVTISGPTTALLGSTETYTVTAQAAGGTLEYKITLPDGTIVNGDTATYTFPSTSTGQNLITATAYLKENNSLAATAHLTTTVSPPPPTISSLTCPSSPYTYQPGSCTVSATAPYGTIGYMWSIDGANLAFSSASANITLSTSGDHTVTVKAFIVGSPSSSVTASKTVTAQQTTITAQLSCPSTFYTTVAGTCTVTATSNWGTLAYTWVTSGAMQQPSASGTSDSITYTATGNQKVQVVTYIKEAGQLATSDTESAPVTVSGLTAPTNVTISGPATAQLGSTQTYTVTAQTTGGGTLVYKITLPDGSVVNGDTATYTYSASGTPGNNTIKATAYLAEDPQLSAGATITTAVIYPAPTISSVTCPASLYTYQPGKCAAAATASGGTIDYSWTVDGKYAASSASATVTIATPGTHTVTVTAYIQETPLSQSQASATVMVQQTDLNATLSCPGTFYTTVADTCTVSATTSWGTPVYHWSVKSATVVPSGDTASIMYNNSGTYTIQTLIYLEEAPGIYTIPSTSVNVIGYSPPTNVKLTGPTSAAVGSTETYTVSATAKGGTLAYRITLPDGSVVNGDTATYTFKTSDVGRKTVTAQAYIAEAPSTMTPSSTMMYTQVDYPAPTIAGLQCPSSLYSYEPGTCTATVSAPYGTLTYMWYVGYSRVGVNQQQVSVMFPRGGNQTVRLVAYIKEDPRALTTATIPVDVTATTLTTSLDCPVTIWKSDTAHCTVTTNNNWGTPTYVWKASQATVTPSADGTSADMNFKAIGYRGVEVDLGLKEAPDLVIKQYKYINVKWITPPHITVSQSPPWAAYIGEPVTYTANVFSPYALDPVQWTINGQTATGLTATTTFDQTGPETVTASVAITGFESFSDGVASYTAYTKVYDLPTPRVQITAPRYAQSGLPITLTVSTSSPVPITGQWTLPDGSPATGDTLTYTPQGADNTQLTFKYTAYVTGHPDVSTTTTATVTVKAYQFPKFTIRPITGTSGYSPYTILCGPTADYSGMIGFNYTLHVHWDFGDGSVKDTEQSLYVSHMYTSSGTFPVTMTVTDNYGNTSTDTIQVTVSEPPPPSLTFKVFPSNSYYTPPLGVAIEPVLTGLSSGDRVTSFEWDLDGVAQDDSMFGYYRASFDSAGNHTVRLTANMLSGLTIYQTQNITVNPDQPPTCTIASTWQPAYNSMAFKPQCTDPDGYVVGYQWDFGNNTTSKLVYPTVKYAPGTYTVTLTATDNSGSTTTVTSTVTAP